MEDKNKKNRDFPRVLMTMISLGVMLGAFNHCVIEAPKSPTKSSGSSFSSTETTSTPTSPTAPSVPAPTIPTPTTPSLSAGEEFFETTVKPAFQSRCMICHTEPVNNPPLPGPLSIYDYNQMRVKLLNGTTATNNELVQKVQGMIAHSGGNQCGGSSPICQNLQDWYAQEMGSTGGGTTTPPNPVNGLTGMVSLVSSTGKVTGYAGDTTNPSTIVGVNFYLDGPTGAGILLNNTPFSASEVGFNGGIAGSHAYSFYIPSIYRDGQQYLLYAYAVDPQTSEEVELQGSPYTFTAYIQTILGYNYYTNTVKPILDNQCASCHAFSYDQNYANLISPSPANGGTAMNNEMINMPSGSHMGENHPGGNICGNKNNSPCSEFQTWWDLEFN